MQYQITKFNFRIFLKDLRNNLRSFIQYLTHPRKMVVYFKNILVLVKKELISFFTSTVGYIVLILFIVILGILLFGVGKYAQFGTSDLSQMFSFIGLTFIIIIPALTMGSISKEKQTGTIEYILTQPISEFKYLISKFISNVIIVIFMLLLTLPIALIISRYGNLDIGQTIMQYFGAFILGICFVSIGIAISALFKNEIASFLTSIFISALFILIGTNLIQLPTNLNIILAKFSLLTYYQSLTRGILDVKDILFFFAILLTFLYIAYYLITKDKLPTKGKAINNIRIGVIITIVIAFLIGSLAQYIHIRKDFTSEGKYTLSAQTVSTLNNIKDNFNITFYNSSNLPQEFQAEIRDVQDILIDYNNYSSGKIQYNIKQPDLDDSIKKTAEANGITQIKFNVSTTDSAQVVVGYFGLTFEYKDKKESLNLDAKSIKDLEYQITKKIKKLTDTNPKKIALASTNVAHTRGTDLTQFAKELTDIYTVTDLDISKPSTSIPSDINLLILDGPNQAIDSKTLNNIKNYFDNGGSIFLMTEPITIDQQTLKGSINTSSLKNLFSGYGVDINENLFYDLKQNNVLASQTDLGQQVLPYPFWPILNTTKDIPTITKGVNTVSLLWPSSISINKTKVDQTNAKITELLRTSTYSNKQDINNLHANFDYNFARANDDTSQLGSVALENAKGGRAIVVGNDIFLADDFLNLLNQRQQDQDKANIAFGLNSISWASRDDAIGSIVSKIRVAPLLNLDSTQSSFLIVAGIFTPIVLITIVGIVNLYRRNRISKKLYNAS